MKGTDVSEQSKQPQRYESCAQLPSTRVQIYATSLQYNVYVSQLSMSLIFILFTTFVAARN